MPTTKTYAFAGGVDGADPFGQRSTLTFSGTWAMGDTWKLEGVTSLVENFTLGRGNLAEVNSATSLLTFIKRMFVGLDSEFAGSDNAGPENDFEPIRFEEQWPGAILVLYLSHFGSQDTVYSLGIIQGRLAVFGRRSIQIWNVDADPNNFALVQVLDNVGTRAPLATQQLGDFDVIFLDDTGFRSLRSREVTLNAYIDDIGSQIDQLVRADLDTVGVTGVCGITEPETKHYWCYINGKIYVLSRHPSSKVSAWGKYLPQDNVGVTFTPSKFITFNGQVIVRGVEKGHYVYGGSNNKTYDAFTVVTVQLPWLYDKKPATLKEATNINAVAAGQWEILLSMDPVSNNFVSCVPSRGTPTAPEALTDSTYDLGNFRTPGLKGTHFSIKMVSTPGAATVPAVFSSLVFHYNDAGRA